MNIEVRNYSEKYWFDFVDLVQNYWSENHPITNKLLFDWQYKGFGHHSNFELFKLLFVNGKMAGFRGVIPGLYHIPDSAEICEGGTFAMWLVIPEYRGMGLGYKLMEAIESECSILMSVGSTLKTSGRIYAANDFTYLDRFHRWTVGLDSRYGELLRDDISNVSVSSEVTYGDCEVEADPELFERIWLDFASGRNLYSLCRTKEFWRWRYIDSPGYKYHYFLNGANDLIVGRIEGEINPPNSNLSDLKIFRFIEVICTGDKNTMQSLLADVLGWAVSKGCCGADFQASNSSFDEYFSSIGFSKQLGDYGSGISSLAGLFNPFQFKPDPINAFWRVLSNGNKIEFGEEMSYLMKSDNDMDRPNHWPII